MTQQKWDTVELHIQRIANGFLVSERKSVDYKSTRSDLLFFPNMEAIERELLTRLKAAQALDMTDAEPHF